MITGLLPNRGASPAADDYVRPASFSSSSARGRSPRARGRPRRPRKAATNQVSAAPSAPTNATSILWAFLMVGLLGTCMNIAYVSGQTALRWETETTTADFGPQHADEAARLAAAVPLPEIHVPKPVSIENNIVAKDGDEILTKERFQDPNDPFYDKEPLIQMVREAGVSPINNATAAALPTWSEITSLYGKEPVYYGLDTCARFRGSGVAANHFLAVAGTFNTGTNLLAELLIANCHMPARMAQFGPNQRGIRWQTVWGKHTPVFNETFRQTHRVYTDVPDLTADDVFAGVMMRDPYRWMQSMCRHSYGASWLHADSHCPSLVPNDADRAAKPHLKDLDHIPVTVEYAEFKVKHDSLIHFWNEWYQDYLNAKFPYLLVRMEDLIYHPKHVVQTVCECAGGELNHGDFKYVTNSAKKGVGAHGKDRTSYLDALSRYGRKAGRTDGLEEADLHYVREHVNPQLMEMFRYPYHDES